MDRLTERETPPGLRTPACDPTLPGWYTTIGPATLRCHQIIVRAVEPSMRRMIAPGSRRAIDAAHPDSTNAHSWRPHSQQPAAVHRPRMAMLSERVA